MTTPTALYRHFDARGELLYVGITDNLQRRWAQHVENSAWAPFVASSHTWWYPTRTEARAAELRAIEHEKPIFNTARKNRRAAARIRSRYLLTGTSGLLRRVPCRAFPDEFCVCCGPDADLFLEGLPA